MCAGYLIIKRLLSFRAKCPHRLYALFHRCSNIRRRQIGEERITSVFESANKMFTGLHNLALWFASLLLYCAEQNWCGLTTRSDKPTFWSRTGDRRLYFSLKLRLFFCFICLSMKLFLNVLLVLTWLHYGTKMTLGDPDFVSRVHPDFKISDQILFNRVSLLPDAKLPAGHYFGAWAHPTWLQVKGGLNCQSITGQTGPSSQINWLIIYSNLCILLAVVLSLTLNLLLAAPERDYSHCKPTSHQWLSPGALACHQNFIRVDGVQ